jgi:putative oxidoreductase
MKNTLRFDVGLLILRVSLGTLFLFYGSMKMFGLFGGRGYTAQVEAFIGQGIMPLFAHLAILAEFLGGLCLLLGFLTPAAALAIASVMAVATFRNMTAPDALTNLLTTGNPQDVSRFFYTFILFFTAISIMVMGAGRYSVDAKLFKRK